MVEKKKCPKCYQIQKIKNVYPYHIKQKAIKYLEVNGLIGISHVFVINWVKQFASKFKNIPKKCEKVDIIELDKMCVSSKKYSFGLLSTERLMVCWIPFSKSKL